MLQHCTTAFIINNRDVIASQVLQSITVAARDHKPMTMVQGNIILILYYVHIKNSSCRYINILYTNAIYFTNANKYSTTNTE